MRALVYSDLQATDGHEKCHTQPNLSLQLVRVDAFFTLLHEIYVEHKCDCLWDLGDTTDDRTSIPVPVIDVLCRNLERFPRSDYSVKLIGNHEQYLRNTQVHVGKLFSPYFNVVESNSVIPVPGKNARILACSYPSKDHETVQWLESNRKSSLRTVVLGHLQVVGAVTSSGELLEGVPKDSLTWADLCLLGHIHKPQSLSAKTHYVGSPFQQDWGESQEDKRVGIVDITDNSVKVTWIPIAGFPEYKKVNLQEFSSLADAVCEDRFKVVIKSVDEASSFYAHPYAHLAEPVYDFDVNSVSSESTEVADKWDFSSVMRRYVEKYTPESKGIPVSNEEMVEFGNEISKFVT